MDQKKIGKFISKLRKKNNMTQSDLANILNVSYKSVSKWENGICLPDPSLYNEICKIFNISKDEFFSGEMKKNNNKIFIVSLICIIVTTIICYFVFNKNVYSIWIIDAPDNISTYNGIVIDGLFEDKVYFNIYFNKPDSYYGIGLYYKENDEYKLIESSYGSSRSLIDDITGYSLFYKSYDIENRYNEEEKYASKIIKNRDNMYLCIWQEEVDEKDALNDNNCHRLVISKNIDDYYGATIKI